MKQRSILDEKLLVAWNAAYWMMRTEARRQRQARYPDCDWRQFEGDDDWVSSVATAQAEVCLEAMGGRKAAPYHGPWVPTGQPGHAGGAL